MPSFFNKNLLDRTLTITQRWSIFELVDIFEEVCLKLEFSKNLKYAIYITLNIYMLVWSVSFFFCETQTSLWPSKIKRIFKCKSSKFLLNFQLYSMVQMIGNDETLSGDPFINQVNILFCLLATMFCVINFYHVLYDHILPYSVGSLSNITKWINCDEDMHTNQLQF